jgi:hypothetical protein
MRPAGYREATAAFDSYRFSMDHRVKPGGDERRMSDLDAAFAPSTALRAVPLPHFVGADNKTTGALAFARPER